MKETTGRQARAAAVAHTNLNTFASITAILEGGCIYESEAWRTAQRIIAICKKEQQRQLRNYDRAMKGLTNA